jgi:anti-sigma regulatory factor (Ser/Thr protein kinase)
MTNLYFNTHALVLFMDTLNVVLPRVMHSGSIEAMLPPSTSDDSTKKIVFDATDNHDASPFALCFLLTLGKIAAFRPELKLPRKESARERWRSLGFPSHAEGFFHIHGPGLPDLTPVPATRPLLPIRSIASPTAVHTVLVEFQQTVSNAFIDTLGLDGSIAARLGTALSELAQNIVEHSGSVGWVAIELETSSERPQLVLSVCDAGWGFTTSLRTSQILPPGTWTDAVALDAAVIRGTSRFQDPGRGQGLAGIRRTVERLGGRLTVRSGRAQILVTRESTQLTDQLARTPGAHLELSLPSRR